MGLAAIDLKRTVACRRNPDFLDGRILAIPSPLAVVEDQHIAGARKAGRNPVRIVRPEELLVRGLSALAGLRVSPPVEQVSPAAVSPSRVPRRLRCGRAVIDDPYLAEIPHGEHDLVAFGVVGDGVHVGPIGGLRFARCVFLPASDIADRLENLQP